MPTKKEREYYAMGYRDGRASTIKYPEERRIEVMEDIDFGPRLTTRGSRQRKPKRKLNSWQKFVKANAKKPRFRSMNNTARFKKLGIAYRKTAAYKRSKK